MSELELAGGLDKLVAGEWRYADAKPFARRMRASVGISGPYLADRLKSSAEPEREKVVELLSQLEGPRVIAPLWELFRDESLDPPVRAAAGALLETLGEASAMLAIEGQLDAEPIITDAREAIFRRAEHNESFRERFLHGLESDDPQGRADVLMSLAEPRDERALPLILPLLCSSRVRTIELAIDALEALGCPAPVVRLQEVAAGDPNSKIRQRARVAYGRLIMQAATFQPKRPPSQASNSSKMPVVHASVSLLDQQGDQAITVGRQRPDGYLKVITVLTNHESGVKSCTGVDMMGPSELEEILETMESQGLNPVDVELPFASGLVSQARIRSVEKRRRLPPELEVWSDLIATPAKPSQSLISPSFDKTDQLLKDTGALLAAPEFRQWFFQQELVWPYVDEWQSGTLSQRSNPDGNRTLEALISLASRDLADRDFVRLLRTRLERQSVLLCRDGKKELAQLAHAAAAGLDPERGLDAADHPFIRAMVLSSFFNAGLRLPETYADRVS